MSTPEFALGKTDIINAKPRCEQCKKLMRDECGGMGSPLTCPNYEPAPTVSQEEIDMWPDYGSATWFRLKKQDDGHHELRQAGEFKR